MSYLVDWDYLFGKTGSLKSPLQLRGFEQPGGLSGKPLLPIVCRLIADIRSHDVRKHINGCGGILGPWSAFKVMRAGADSISVGSAAILAPWGVLPAIITAHVVHWCRFNFSKEYQHAEPTAYFRSRSRGQRSLAFARG
jgi:dihydroorotate dehydrogenase